MKKTNDKDIWPYTRSGGLIIGMKIMFQIWCGL